ncbi:MAG: SRPBCC family protein [Pseudomonadota bacterium]
MVAISLEEKEIIQRMLAHCAAGTTDMVEDVGYHPVSNYADPERLQLELDTVFRNFPIILGHCSQLSEPGEFITHTATGIPILVTRNKQRQIKAFINVCRHRGMIVAQADQGQALTFSCPYHNWTYDLDGNLRGLPQPTGFGTIDKTKLALVELPAFERFGLIWVKPTASEQTIDIDRWLAPMAEQLSSLDLSKHVLFKTWSIDTDMNWRLALEGFQECYHFCSAHKDTACAGYLNNQSVFLDQYPHVRHAVPLPNISKLAKVPEADWHYRPHFMTQNFLFPCNFAQVMTDHVYIHSIFPTGPGKCVFKCMMLIPEAPVDDKAARHWERNYNVVRTVFGEDFEIGQQIQMGLNSGANEHFLFGRYEYGLHLGRRAIDDAVEGRLTCPTTA